MTEGAPRTTIRVKPMAPYFKGRRAKRAAHDLTILDPPLETLLGELRSFGVFGESEIAKLRARYGKPYEPPYWRFFLETPAERPRDVPAAARRLVVSAKAPDCARLGEFSKLEAVSVSDFRAGILPILAELPELKCLAVWSGPLTDLQGFGVLQGLEHLLVFGASRLRTLDGLEELRSLKTLRLAGVPKVKRLDPLGALDGLQGLELQAGIQSGTLADRTKFASLRPLRTLTNLKVLRMWAIRTEDDDLSPIVDLSPLENIEVPPRTFPLDAMAPVAAAYPELREQWSKPLGAVVPCSKCGEKKAMLIGRGTRDICPRCLPRKIEEFFALFEARVNESRRNLGSRP